jgi:acyl carrier protein
VSAEAVSEVLQGAYWTVKGGTVRLERGQHIVDELGLDSLQQMEIVYSLEQTLGVEIAGDQRLLEVRTVGDLDDLLVALTNTSGLAAAPKPTAG